MPPKTAHHNAPPADKLLDLWKQYKELNGETKMKRLTIVTLLLLLCLSGASLLAQQSQNPQSDALKIAEISKQLQELKNKHTMLENENTKLKTKLADVESKFVQVDYGNLLPIFRARRASLIHWQNGLNP